MTQNQLKYWELRWRQYYESRTLEIDRAKLELEIRKLAETIRHNKVGEKQEKQRIVTERQKLSLEWSKLNETIRSNIVKEGIEVFKAQETQRSNLNKEAQNLMKILGDQAIALGDLMIQAEDSKNKNSAEFIKDYKNAFGAIASAFGADVLAVGAGELRAAIGADNYDKIVQATIDSFPQFKGILQTDGVVGIKYSPDNKDDMSKRYTEMYGPDAVNKIRKDAELPFSSDKHVIGFTHSEDYTSDNNKSADSKIAGSSVIYTDSNRSVDKQYTGPGVDKTTGSSVVHGG